MTATDDIMLDYIRAAITEVQSARNMFEVETPANAAEVVEACNRLHAELFHLLLDLRPLAAEQWFIIRPLSDDELRRILNLEEPNT